MHAANLWKIGRQGLVGKTEIQFFFYYKFNHNKKFKNNLTFGAEKSFSVVESDLF
jgi:hypothetical protein